jgi:hypothetical protein
MPVDKPKKGETQEEYLKYCIPAEINNGMEADQASAVCYSYWDKDKMSKVTDTNAKVMARVAYDTKFRGINLMAEAGEDPCWDGYEQYGTKDMDGREVPNCIPVEEKMAKIPLDIIGDNEEKILEYLPTPKANEREDAYLERCIIVLYPEYYDQTMATALCADKYQRKTTVTNLKNK